MRFLRRRGAAVDEAEAIADDTLSTLATPPPRGGARTRIGTYDGRGALKSWLSTVAWRQLITTWRGRRGVEEIPQGDAVPAGTTFPDMDIRLTELFGEVDIVYVLVLFVGVWWKKRRKRC